MPRFSIFSGAISPVPSFIFSFFLITALLTLPQTAVAAPSAPSSISAPSSATEGKSYTVSWSSVSGATRYELVGEQSGLIKSTSGTSASRSKSPGTYYYKVRACNSSGCSGYSGKTGGTTVKAAPAPTPTPGRPGSFKSTKSTIIQGTRVTLSWTKPSNTISGYVYKLYGRSPGGSDAYLGQLSGTSSNRTPNFVGQYRYRVRACNPGNVCGSYATLYIDSTPALPSIPAAPNVSANAPVNANYSISWSKPSGTVSSYELYENNVKIYSGTATSRTRKHTSAGNRSYRVKACNSSGCTGLSGTDTIYVYSGPGAPQSFAASPATITQYGSTTLSWSKPGGTVSGFVYKLYATTPVNSSEVFLEDLTTNSSTRKLHNIGQYRYRVRACNPNNLCSSYATVYVTSNPQKPAKVGNITAPSEKAKNKSFRLSWAAVGGPVTEYQLYVDNARIYRGGATYFDYAAPATGNKKFKVRACNAGGCGTFSNAKTVIVYTTPGNISTFSTDKSSVIVDSAVVLSWSAAPGAVSSTYYQLYAVTPTSPESLIENNLTTRSSTRNPGQLGQYEYRVRACSPQTGCGVKKSVTFTVVKPIIGPGNLPTVSANVPIDTDYEVSWTASSGASSYYQLYENGQSVYFGTGRSYETKHNGSGFRKYKVRACVKQGVCGSFSNEKSMYVFAAPGAPTNFVATPSTIELGGSTTLSWQKPGGALSSVQYKLYATSPGSNTEVFLGNLSATNSGRTLQNLGTYRYRVRACNSDALCGSFATLDITVNPKKPGAVSSFSVPIEVAKNTALNVTWGNASGIVERYELYQGTSRVVNELVSSYRDTPNTASTLSFKVRACNISGCGSFSQVKNTTVFDSPDVPTGFTSSKPSITVDSAIELSWTPPTNGVSGTTYNLYAVTPSSVEALIESNLVTTRSTRNPGQLGRYTYRVEACSPNVGCGGSRSVSFDVTKPAIGVPQSFVAPQIVALDQELELSWGAASGSANEYQVYENGTSVYLGDSLSFKTQKATAGINTYKVRACHKAGICGEFTSEAQVQIYGAPGKPENLINNGSPAKRFSTVTISWESAPGEVDGVIYKVFADTPSSNNIFLEDLQVRTRSRDLSQIGDYTYRVQACNPNGAGCGEFAETSITISPPATESNLSVLYEGSEVTEVYIAQPVTLSWNVNQALSCVVSTSPAETLEKSGQVTRSFYAIGATDIILTCTMPDDTTEEYSQSLEVIKLASPENLRSQ